MVTVWVFGFVSNEIILERNLGLHLMCLGSFHRVNRNTNQLRSQLNTRTRLNPLMFIHLNKFLEVSINLQSQLLATEAHAAESQ